MISLKQKFAYGFFAFACIFTPYGLWQSHSISPNNIPDDAPSVATATEVATTIKSPPSAPQKKTFFIGIGDTAKVGSGAGVAEISRNRDTLTELVKAAAAKDYMLLGQLLQRAL